MSFAPVICEILNFRTKSLKISWTPSCIVTYSRQIVPINNAIHSGYSGPPQILGKPFYPEELCWSLIAFIVYILIIPSGCKVFLQESCGIFHLIAQSLWTFFSSLRFINKFHQSHEKNYHRAAPIGRPGWKAISSLVFWALVYGYFAVFHSLNLVEARKKKTTPSAVNLLVQVPGGWRCSEAWVTGKQRKFCFFFVHWVG